MYLFLVCRALVKSVGLFLLGMNKFRIDKKKRRVKFGIDFFRPIQIGVRVAQEFTGMEVMPAIQ